MDTSMNESRGAFPVDRPVDALMRDHGTVRKLVDAYRACHDDADRINAAEQILMLLETHSLLEETVFYPAVRDVDASMIANFEHEHQKADELIAALKGMALNDPKAASMIEQVIDMTMRHIDEEETEFFPKLELANLDMTPVGLQMQAFEANLVHTQVQASQQNVRR